MSAETRRTMIEAIGAHAADEYDGAILMDWVFVGYIPRFGQEAAETNSYLFDGSTATDHVLRGLLGVGSSSLDGLGRADDDE